MDKIDITKNLTLQLITQKESTGDILSEVQAFLDGGGRWVQLRMKGSKPEEIIETGRQVSALCKSYGATFIVNDHPAVVRETGADGVHLGKSDMSPDEARSLLGDGKIIGCTANTFEDIERLSAFPIDYIGLGPFRFTTTKKNLSPVLGTEGYRDIFTKMTEKRMELPVVAIGGIEIADVPLLRKAGVKFYAVSGAISKAPYPKETTEEFLQEIEIK